MDNVDFSDHAVWATFGRMRELLATATSEGVAIYDPDCGVRSFVLDKDAAEQFGKWLIEKAKEM